ncbi:MAG: FAD binding domain-containing protein [Haloarculaceae archaeon]
MTADGSNDGRPGPDGSDAAKAGGGETGDDEVDYYAPETVDTARRRLAEATGVTEVVAGGQTLSLLVRHRLVDADALVDVSGVPALSGVSVTDGTAVVGATTTYAGLAAHDLSDRVAMLGDACEVIADRQVRTLGTVGGAVCHADPAFDVLAPLRCLDADLRIGGVDGERRVPLAEFVRGHMRTDLGDDELLETVRFDLPGAPSEPPDGWTGSAYEKHAAVEGGWPAVGVAACVTLANGAFADVRVGLTAVADTTVRSPGVEAALTGEPVAESAVAAASEAVTGDVDPIDDQSGSAEYKRRLAPTLVERALATAVRRAEGSP